MKDSSIPYCREIPNDWKEIPNRYLFNYHSVKVGEQWKNYQLLSLTTSGIKKKDINVSGGKVPDSYEKYQTVEPGDMVFCLFDLDVSAVFSGLSKFYGMITSAYDVVKPNQNLLVQGFSDYWFRYVFSNRYYKIYSKNIRYTISSEMFKAINTPIPPLDVQQKIAAYLDKKCGEIDKLIELENKQIEKLKDYKVSVITEAVTKGLDPSSPLKDSGIQWIGQIPAGWEVIRLKDWCVNKKEIVGEKSNSYERLALTLNGVIKRPKDDSDGLQPKEFDTYQILEENDFVFKMIDLQNISTSRVGLSPYTGLVSPAYIRFAPRKIGQFNFFIYYYLMSLYYNCVFNSMGGDGVRSALSATDMGNFLCPFPPIETQQKIAAFLDKKCADIGKLIEIKQKKIETLSEYKKSLIYECVTGKKEILS